MKGSKEESDKSEVGRAGDTCAGTDLLGPYRLWKDLGFYFVVKCSTPELYAYLGFYFE